MIVYGDPAESMELAKALSYLRERVAHMERHGVTVDRMRGLLAETGRVEQGLADAGAAATLEALDVAARLWMDSWENRPVDTGEFQRALQAVRTEQGPPILLKVPEGFAFYGVYPEAYVLALRRWVRDTSPAREKALVVGLRSIGTTLSAVAAEALRREGFSHVHRITIRPHGHPYQRKASLDPTMATAITWGVILDEGPGRSGSSLYSASRALEDAGIPLNRQVVFSAHGKLGDEASDQIQTWWAHVRRYAAGDEVIRWNGRTVHEELVARAAELLECVIEEVRMVDMSGGLWRDVLGIPWAPAWGAFERAKYLCLRGEGAAARGWLWKFAGLSADGSVHGFLGRPWVEGRVLNGIDLDQSMLGEMAEYLADRSHGRLSPQESAEAVERLRHMAYENIRERLGEDKAERFNAWTDCLRETLVREGREAPDGRMGPWEWVRAIDGGVVKVDADGHAMDHTMIGRQSLWWDVAGAAVEWEMSDQVRTQWVAVLGQTNSGELGWFCCAYAAFRLGMSVMCGVDGRRYLDLLQRELSAQDNLDI